MKWKVWYEDTFDRECPRQVQTQGRGLMRGLIELWSRHLFETVRPNGSMGFARFNLWWHNTSIEIVGDPKGAARLRAWIWGQSTRGIAQNRQAADPRLLRRLAKAHARLIREKHDSTAILALAASAENRREFEDRLSARDWD